MDANRSTPRLAKAAVAAVCALAACTGDGAADARIELSFPASALPLRIDSACVQDCTTSALLQVAYPDDFFAEGDLIDFVAYRVDYDLGRGLDGSPFYAQPISVTLRPGDIQNLRLTLAGERQRAFFAQRRADADLPRRGRATLQLAGYDWNDDQVFVEIEASLDLE